jgi:hypothetical protein
MEGPYWSTIQPWALMKGALKNLSTYVVGIWGRSSRRGHRKITKRSLLEPATGNFNSLLSQKDSLFFLSPDASPKEVKHRESCSMPGGAACARGPKPQNFPVKFPVSREMGYGERIARDCLHHQSSRQFRIEDRAHSGVSGYIQTFESIGASIAGPRPPSSPRG